MGKVIELLKKIREMKHGQLLERFKHIVRARAIREYIAAKEDLNLTLEVNLIEEEITHRMSMGHSSYVIINHDSNDNDSMKEINKKLNIAFDIDHTLWEIVKGADGKYHQIPDYDLIQVLRWFYANGDKIYVWSAGGTDFAQTIVCKLGLDTMVTVIAKEISNNGIKMDLCFDDEADVELASVNIIIRREEFKDNINI